MSLMSASMDQIRYAFMERAGDGTISIRKYNGRTASATSYDNIPAYQHYPQDDDLQTLKAQGVDLASEDLVVNVMTGDLDIQLTKEDRVDVDHFSGSKVTYKVKSVLKRQYPEKIGSKPLVDRVLICPIPMDNV